MNFGCGVVAGIMASVVTQPADVVKTNIQISRSRLGTLEAARHIYKVPVSGAVQAAVEEGARSSLPVCGHRNAAWEASSAAPYPGACAAR